MDSSTPPETERLLMAANLHRMRGEVNEAEAMVRTALEREPGDFLAREFLGDLLSMKGDAKGAEAEYRSILQDSPGRPQVEEKLARLILKTAPIAPAATSGVELRTDRNPVTVGILSLAFPGAGHIYLGDKVKGLIFGSVAVLLLFGMVPALFGMTGSLAGSIGGRMDPTGNTVGGAGSPASGAGQLALWGFLFTALQLYTAYDSYRMARNTYRS